MERINRDLYSLFAPPPGLVGTNMLLCGLSADVDTLERIMVAFTAETSIQRRASGLVRTALMLDASAKISSPLAVPGLLRLSHRSVEHWTEHTSLMHAKVALMGFASVAFGMPTIFRLVVSTGNWTQASWESGNQIDFYWSTECRADAAGNPTQEKRDVAAAFKFITRMMSQLFPDSSSFLATQQLASGWLTTWRTLLPERRGYTQFIHSLDKSLFAQIKKSFPDNINTLVAGSGFFEQAQVGVTTKPQVLSKLEELIPSGSRYLVLNPANAGALAGWVSANLKKSGKGKLDGWIFCTPTAPLQKGKGSGRTSLHAKYLAGLRRVEQKNDRGTVVGLYIGSGNLSRAGILSYARLENSDTGRRKAGNVEAGVCLVKEQVVENVWKSLACGDVMLSNAINDIIPGQGEEMLVALAPPPILFAQRVRERLRLVRSDAPGLDLQIQMCSGGEWVTLPHNENELIVGGSTAFPVVWVRCMPTTEALEPEVFEVPVFAANGALCRQAPPELSVDDVLSALLAFPGAPPEAPEPGVATGAKAPPKTSVSASDYPLRTLATMIEIIARRNCSLSPEQFPYWLNQLRSLLLDQVTVADLEAIGKSRVNLFPALREPGFVPLWLNDDARLKEEYLTLIVDIELAWAPAYNTESGG